MSEECSIEGRWALITGSSRGVGRQVALGLAAKGCNVVLHSRKEGGCAESRSLMPAGIEVREVWGELDRPGAARKIAEEAETLAGGVDILYNNAAIMTGWVEVMEDIPMKDFELSMQVNLYAMHELCSFFVPRMTVRGWGRIVNATSGIGFVPQLTPYCISKAAVDKFTGNLAERLKGSGVLANLLDPGWLKTDLGGNQAPADVESVLPGALAPVLVPDGGSAGQLFRAQDYSA